MVRSRRYPVPPTVTITPPFEQRANAAIPRLVSAASRPLIGCKSSPSGSPTDRTPANWPTPGPPLGSRITATRVTGAVVSKSPSCALQCYNAIIHSRQAHKPSPPLKFAAEFDVVFASKRQFAVLANPEYRQCRWDVANIVAVAHVHVDNARSDQDPAAGVYAEGTDVKGLRVFVLD